MDTTQFNKEYLNYTKEEAKKWHLYMGGTPQVVAGKTMDDFDWGRDVNFLYRIRENEINFITARYDWKKRIKTGPWKINSTIADHKLIFNANNNIAYLCISDNTLNRSDISIRGKNLSLFAPSHTVGSQLYPDGYSWYALFSIDPNKMDLVTSNSIPVPVVDDYSKDSSNTTLEYLYQTKCGSDYKENDGTCCLYYRQKFIDSTGISYERGDLTPVKFVSRCYECVETANKLGYDYTFLAGVTVPYVGKGVTLPLSDENEVLNGISGLQKCSPCECKKSVYTKIEQIGNNILELNPSGSFKFLYNSYSYWNPTKQGILSVFINLESLTDAQRTVSVENPTVFFDSISGTGASAKLVTQPLNNGYYVVGIELISSGSGYNVGDAIPRIENNETSILNSLIEVNVSPEDFPENPSSMLNNLKTCIKVTVDNDMVKNISNTELSEFTKYGILKDVKSTNNVPATAVLNTNEPQISRTTTKLTLTPTGTVNIDDNPSLDLADKNQITLSQSDSKKGIKAYFDFSVNSSLNVTSGTLELITKDYDNITVGDTIKVNDESDYVVSSVEKPKIAFGTGVPLVNQNTYIKFPNKNEINYKPRKAVTFTIIKS